MGELIDDLLSLAKISRASVDRVKVDLSSIVRGVADNLQFSDPDRPVTLVIQGSITAQADPRLIQIALENLVGNAWKFSGKVDSPRIEFRAEEIDGETRYFVRDNGAGFDSRYVAKLFQPFQRLHSESQFAGTGIGLATVQRVVDRHGGRVWAESAIGQGATFFFTLGPTKVGQ
jgi:light-regulated signal transduction histidine kinase (bacteriophytochrome)